MRQFRFGGGGRHEVLLLDADDIASFLDMRLCIEGVEGAFRRLADGSAPAPGVLSFEAGDGHFHIKAGLSGDGYFVAKVNGNYPENPKSGLPTIQGLVMLADAENGRPLALLDSAELTARRTGAATGVAIKHLAVAAPVVVTLCGCGRQAESQLDAIAAVRTIVRVQVCDLDFSAAARFAKKYRGGFPIEAFELRSLRARALQSDVVITCTPSRQALLGEDDVRPGCVVAAVGADNPHKQELRPQLMRRSKVVADLVEQCAVMGDLHHAIAAGLMSREDVHAELGEVVTGRKPGRTDDREIIVFDSTGIALQDVVTAAAVYERAVSEMATARSG